MKKRIIKRWTPAELEKLHSTYLSTSWKELTSVFGRSIASINQKALSVGLLRGSNSDRSRFWSLEEEQYLRDHYPTQGTAVASIIGRAATAVLKKAQDLGVSRKIANSNCSFKRHTSPIGSERIIGRHLMRRVALTGIRKQDWRRVDVIEWEAINGPVPDGMFLAKPTRQRDGTDLRLVTIEELPMLAALNCMSPEMRNLVQIKARLNYALTRIEKQNPDQAIQPRIPKKYTTRPNSWRTHENDYLRENYLNLDNTDLAKSLGRTPRAVEHQLLILGIKRPRRNSWSKEEDKKLLTLYVTTSISELMRIFGRTKPAIYQRAKRLGLEKAKT